MNERVFHHHEKRNKSDRGRNWKIASRPRVEAEVEDDKQCEIFR